MVARNVLEHNRQLLTSHKVNVKVVVIPDGKKMAPTDSIDSYALMLTRSILEHNRQLLTSHQVNFEAVVIPDGRKMTPIDIV